MSGAPLLATKATYKLFTDSCKKIVADRTAPAPPAAAAADSPAPLNPEHTRILKNALNDHTQSVFLTLRANLRVEGRMEEVDPTLDAKVAQAQSEFREARIELQALHHRAAKLVDQALKAPLAHLGPDGRVEGEAPLAPTHAQQSAPAGLQRIATASESLASAVSDLSSTLPALITGAGSLTSLLSEKGSKPVSESIRNTLEKLNSELDKGKKKVGGKVTKSPARAARNAAKPY